MVGDGGTPVPVTLGVPSPKETAHDEMALLPPVLLDASKLTVRGASPSVLVGVRLIAGTGPHGGPLLRINGGIGVWLKLKSLVRLPS